MDSPNIDHVTFNMVIFSLPLPAAQGIVVKVMHKKLGDKYYRKKGVVESLKDEFTAIVQMLDSKDKLKIDQLHLETVIPAIGEQTHLALMNS